MQVDYLVEFAYHSGTCHWYRETLVRPSLETEPVYLSCPAWVKGKTLRWWLGTNHKSQSSLFPKLFPRHLLQSRLLIRSVLSDLTKCVWVSGAVRILLICIFLPSWCSFSVVSTGLLFRCLQLQLTGVGPQNWVVYKLRKISASDSQIDIWQGWGLRDSVVLLVWKNRQPPWREICHLAREPQGEKPAQAASSHLNSTQPYSVVC